MKRNRTHTTRSRQSVHDEAADALLVDRAAAGDPDAFEELYRRHLEAAWRLALAVSGDPHDAADAVSDAFTRVFQALARRPYGTDRFLPYLLAAVRNAAIDGLRRGSRRVHPDDDEDGPAVAQGPAEALVAGVEAGMVAQAFRDLPERWRSVLWLTEVEEIPAREVAGLLGLSPNGVAQLALRARAGLRQRYLQAHLHRAEVGPACRHTVDRLGAYAVGGLAPRDIAKVDQHLAACGACRSRLAELRDVTPSLRCCVLPLPAFLLAASTRRWLAAAGTSGTAAAGAATAPVAGVGIAGAVLPVPLVAVVASAALVVVGFVGAGGRSGSHGTPPAAPVPAAVAAAPAAALTGAPPAVAPAPPGDPVAPPAAAAPLAALPAAPAGAPLAGVRSAVHGVVAGLPVVPAPEVAAVVSDTLPPVGAVVTALPLPDPTAPCADVTLPGCDGTAVLPLPIRPPAASTGPEGSAATGTPLRTTGQAAVAAVRQSLR